LFSFSFVMSLECLDFLSCDEKIDLCFSFRLTT